MNRRSFIATLAAIAAAPLAVFGRKRKPSSFLMKDIDGKIIRCDFGHNGYEAAWAAGKRSGNLSFSSRALRSSRMRTKFTQWKMARFYLPDAELKRLWIDGAEVSIKRKEN